MSVWNDMGFLPDGAPFGVDPYTFLRTAYDFWAKLRGNAYPAPALPPFDFDRRRKAGDMADQWSELNERLSFPPPWHDYIMSHPIPASMWAAAPDWPAVSAMSVEDILGESVIPCPYYSPVWDVMHPDWPKQRLKLIRLTRYAVVPLHIVYSFFGMVDVYYAILGGFSWYGDDSLDITFPEYWARASERKIGIQGEAGKPISGTFWQDDSLHFQTEAYTGQTLYIQGAVDLATHPDFKDYFDVNAG